MKYNPIEKTIAKKLDSNPHLKNIVKNMYQRLIYIKYKKSRAYELNNNIDISAANIEKEFFYGYYDKSPWLNENILYHEVINNSSKVNLVLWETANKKKKIIGNSNAWNFQQGSMLQWIEEDKIIFNDIVEDKLVAKVISPEGIILNVLDYPIQALNPNGKNYLSINYKRLFDCKTEYGYENHLINFSGEMELEKDGIWMVDIDTGKSSLIIDLHTLIKHDSRVEMQKAEHLINHIMYSPKGDKIIFMHRWIGPKGKFSRLYLYDLDSKKLKILFDDRMVSHCCWLDNNNIILWARKIEIGDRYYIYNVNKGDIGVIGEGELDSFGDGHPSISPNKKWLLTDTYPDKSRHRKLLLYNLENKELFNIGSFFSPWKYNGKRRCDLHPRWSPDGKKISIDSTHEGMRKSYILDLSVFFKKVEDYGK
ncbi:hypothetical protein [Bacillus sp. Marseille-Q1617]|uniref:TolB family protein n=1 Tax=Bacillus sp. Marseille-Q1617 TaxID=2736887 RepID=UPI001589348F|nr:hypothetical protein [Bacillus sp. Marseille-Q1617]